MNVITYSVCDYDEYSGKKTDMFSAYKNPNVAFFSKIAFEARSFKIYSSLSLLGDVRS